MKRGALCIVLLVLLAGTAWGQVIIDLYTALERARSQHVQLKAQRLYLQQQATLKDVAKGHPPTTIAYGVEEWGVAGTGIHSLSLNQSFNLPAVAQRRADLQDALVEAGSSQLVVLERQIMRAVAQQYQRVLFYKNQQLLNQQLIHLYDSIVVIAEQRAKVGETGRLPLLATQNARQQLVLQQLQTQQQLGASVMELQQLLYDTTITGIADSLLLAPPLDNISIATSTHPLLLQVLAQKEVLNNQRAVVQSQWLPQWTVGAQLQVVEGSFPNGGAQIGWSIPLFRQGLQAQLKANALEQEQLDVQGMGLAQQIDLERQKALQQFLSLSEQFLYLEKEILPTLELQQELLRRAYAVGELDYLNVLQSLQQVLATRQQHLDVLLALNVQWVEYLYWKG